MLSKNCPLFLGAGAGALEEHVDVVSMPAKGTSKPNKPGNQLSELSDLTLQGFQPFLMAHKDLLNAQNVVTGPRRRFVQDYNAILYATQANPRIF